MDVSTGRRGKCAEFSFEPRCIASAHGIVAAGGPYRGQIGLATQTGAGLPATSVHTFELGGYINNAITLFRRDATSVSALVCNNDHTLRILDVTDARHSVLDVVRMSVKLNHSSISPDRKTIIACGDSAHVFVLHPEEGLRAARLPDEPVRVDSNPSSSPSTGASTRTSADNPAFRWHPTATLVTSSDAGLSTAFAPSGVMFAVASQDGMASIYDSRYLSSEIDVPSAATSRHSHRMSQTRRQRPLKYVESTRPLEGSGAFRCLKFSSGSEDLLLITEQTGRVHVVDSRRLEYRQILDIPDNSPRQRMPFESHDHSTMRHTQRWHGDGSGNVEEMMWRFSSSRVPHSSSAARHHHLSDEETEEDDDRYCATDVHEGSGSGSGGGGGTNWSIGSIESRRVDFSNARLPPREKDIAGLAWSDDDGGSIIVGWDGGIGKWTIDNRGRRVFPSYIMR